MKYRVIIPSHVEKPLIKHLFQDDLEQGAFLFANIIKKTNLLILKVFDVYLVPKTGWDYQSSVCLEMKDTERVKIMKKARNVNAAIIDCHSHPIFKDDLWFSPSDIHGITQFAHYAKWKLDNKPYSAMVFGGNSLDAIIWDYDLNKVKKIDEVIIGKSEKIFIPLGTWFQKPVHIRRKKWHQNDIQDKS